MKQNRAFALIITMLVIVFGFIPGAWPQEKAEDFFIKGNSLSRQGRFKEAVEAYERSIEKNPNSTVVHFNLGLAYKNMKRMTEAAIAFERTVELEPGNLDARYSLGNIYNHLERWEDAIAQLNLVVHRRHDDAEAHGNLGWAYYNYRKGPRVKYLVIINLKKAVELFESKKQPRAANATREILEEAIAQFGFQRNN